MHQPTANADSLLACASTGWTNSNNTRLKQGHKVVVLGQNVKRPGGIDRRYAIAFFVVVGFKRRIYLDSHDGLASRRNLCLPSGGHGFTAGRFFLDHTIISSTPFSMSSRLTYSPGLPV